MKTVPKISEAELRVMKVLWSHSPMTTNEVIEAMSGQTDWNHRTIRTLLTRLVKKKILSSKKQGRQFEYRPLISEAQALKAERHSFLRRCYDGALLPMLAGFLEDESLSENDVQRLKSLLDRQENQHHGTTE